MSEQLTSAQVSAFCQDMQMMCQAGIVYDEALELACSSDDAATAHAAQAALDAQRKGASLADSLSQTKSFPSHMVHMVQVAEQAGRLEEAFGALANYYQGVSRKLDRLRSALLYPMILLALMTLVMLVLAFLVLPIFSDVYTSMANQLSHASMSYATAAKVVSYIAVAIVLVFAIVFLVGTLIVYLGHNTATVTRLLEKMPLTRRVSYTQDLSSAINAMGLYTASGIDPITAVESIIPEIGNTTLKKRFNACLEKMRLGSSFAQAARELQVMNPLHAAMLVSAERSGAFDSTFIKLSQLMAEDADKSFERTVTSIEPACTAFLTIAVVLALVAIIVPLMGILGAIG